MSRRSFGQHQGEKTTSEWSVLLLGTGANKRFDPSQVLETLRLVPVPLDFYDTNRPFRPVEQNNIRTVAIVGHVGRLASSDIRARVFGYVPVGCFQQEAFALFLAFVHRLRDAGDEEALDARVM